MFKFTRNVVAYVLIIVMFITIQININQHTIRIEKNENMMRQEAKQETENLVENTTEKSEIWQIEIPKISLIANIAEGTTKEVLEQYVGHFEQTQKENGNIGLAAHNRGYKVNYFEKLKLLKEGDEIKYKYNDIEKIYEVEKCRIIRDTEWEYLENTEENMLTLITCVENEPEYRRCIQAVEKEEEPD